MTQISNLKETNYELNPKFVKNDNNSFLQSIKFRNTPIHKFKIKKQVTKQNDIAEILFITSYPPRECGIATYSQDLIKALNNKFGSSFNINICALENGISNLIYPKEVKFSLDTNNPKDYLKIVDEINNNNKIKTVVLQHEFGFFENLKESEFLDFLFSITKPIIIGFHTVLPNPSLKLRSKLKLIIAACESIIVMTNNSAKILIEDYSINSDKVNVIAHGTHLVLHLNKESLKEKYDLVEKKVLTTFGLLSSGKSIETTLYALPEIIKLYPNVMFLILGKTHPGVIKNEGEIYREMLEALVISLNLENNVKFVNKYLPLEDLLEYLQLSDIYLFTSKDPNQAVSGTFAYAMSCACPIISTPIPHALELLRKDTGIICDFQNSEQLTKSIIKLLNDNSLLASYSASALERIVPTAWENSAIKHSILIEKTSKDEINLKYKIPNIKLSHLMKMTDDFGMFQFSIFNQPDSNSGYTIDDNARALISMCMLYEIKKDESILYLIHIYLNFISYCQQVQGNFLNYVDKDFNFTEQNYETNLEDSNGRTIWALGFLISKFKILPFELVNLAKVILDKALNEIENNYSTRAMAFMIEGLYDYNLYLKSSDINNIIITLADRLVNMYKSESDDEWKWFESYMTYGNSKIPEAMLCAWLATGNEDYKQIAIESFDFLLSLTFNDNGIKVISNKSWLKKGEIAEEYGEQPIDVSYTILALNRFNNEFDNEDYLIKLETAFNWFLGKNHLHQIIYNPCTGGCYDGLEEYNVNLNQGAESTLSYLLARLTVENIQK